MRNTRKGFTLVELLVVIAILAVLATVSVVGYTSFIDRANNSNAETELHQIQSYINADLMADNTWEYELEDGTEVKVVKNADGTYTVTGAASFADAINNCPDFAGLGTCSLDTDGNVVYTCANGKGTATWKVSATVTTTPDEGGDDVTGGDDTTETHTCADSNNDFVCDTDGCNEIVAPVADSTLSIADALKLAALYENDEGTKNTDAKYYIEGTIATIDNATFGQMTITDGNNSIMVYGTYSEDGTVRYDAMESKPVVGDKVKLYGQVGAHYTTLEMVQGWLASHTAHTHQYEGGKCTICEAVDPSVTPSYLTLDFTNANNCISIDANEQTWQENGITVTNTKNSSTTNVNNYTPANESHARFYKNSKLDITCGDKAITKIVLNCTATKYADIPNIDGATVTKDGTTVTIEFTSAVESLSVVLSSAQVRVTSIDVYTAE